MNPISLYNSELVVSDDISTNLFWWGIFMEAQGLNFNNNIPYQDDKSTTL